MAIPLMCATCGDIVGVTSAIGFPLASRLTSVPLNCPGRGNHSKPERTEEKKLWGLIKKIKVVYPETRSMSLWEEYVGPPKKLWLWLAIVFGTERKAIVVSGKWAFWSRGLGLYGDGVKAVLNNR